MLESRDRSLANNTLNLVSEDKLPFWSVCDQLSDRLQPYDVLIFPDGRLRPDSLTIDDLSAYSSIVLPHCHVLTAFQAELLADYLDSGGSIARIGPVGSNLPGDLRHAVESHARIRTVGDPPALEDLVGVPQVRTPDSPKAALSLQRVDEGVSVHLIRYDFDRARDIVPPLEQLSLEIEIDEEFVGAEPFGAPKAPVAELRSKGKIHSLRLRDVPLYSVTLLRRGNGSRS
jgi:hypothetical protein